MASRALQGARPVQAIREARAVPAGAGHTDRDWREPRRRRDRRLSRRTAGGDLPHPGVRVLRRSHVAPGDHDLSSRAEGAGWTGHDRRHGDCMSLGVRPSCSDARSVAVRSASSRSPRSDRSGTALRLQRRQPGLSRSGFRGTVSLFPFGNRRRAAAVDSSRRTCRYRARRPAVSRQA